MIQGTNSLYRGDVAGVLNTISMAEMGLVGLLLMPPAMVGTRADYFWKWDGNQGLRMPTPQQADGANPQRDKYTLTQDTYKTVLYEEEAKVTGSEIAEVDFALKTAIAKIKASEILRAQEKRIATLLQSITTFPDDSGAATGMTPSVKWDVQATSTPVDDIILGKLAVQKKCGKEPDTLVVGNYTYAKLCICKQVRESAVGVRYAAAYNRGALLPADALAEALGVKRVLKAGALYTTSNKGQSTVTNDFIWDQTKAFLCVTDASQNGGGQLVLDEPCIGRTIAWSEFGGMLEVNEYGERVDDQIINVRQHVTEKVLLSECGFLFQGVK